MKNWKYLKYIIRHKWYVMMECFKQGLIWRGIMHDMSKFLPDEFFPYAEYFYGKKQGEEFFKFYGKYADINLVPYGLLVKDKFNIAWLKHIHRNKHHWQHWLLQEDDGNLIPIPMPDKYVGEMIADWDGAGMAITGKNNTREWYLQNRDKIKLSNQTKHQVEIILNVL